MPVFDVNEFICRPSVEVLQSSNPRKDDLKYIATHFKIDYNPDITKPQLQQLILEHLRSEEGQDGSSLSAMNTDSQTLLELEKLKFQTLILESQEREKDRLEKERDRQEREKDRQHELQILQLKQTVSHERSSYVDITKFTKLTPCFSESNPEVFFREFESTAKHFNWPKDHWIWLVKPKLTGKAVKVCEGLEDNTDYDEVKTAILTSYAITTEGYRQAFRNLNKLNFETYMEFASEKLRAFQRWIKSASVNSLDDLINLMVLEEFKRKVPYQIVLHLTDKEETDLLKAAKLADVFSLVHRHASGEKRRSPIVQLAAGSNINPEDKVGGQTRLGVQNRPLICKFCKKDGHVIKNCPDPRCKVAKVPMFTKPLATINFSNHVRKEQDDIFQAFRSKGTVSVDSDSKKYNVNIVRDTASAKTIIAKKAFPGINKCYTGEKVYLQVLNSTIPVKLAKIYLESDLVKGSVTVGVIDSEMPIPDASLLLGNDLAGNLIVPKLKVRFCHPIQPMSWK
ncbi:uncharacterized protein LOC122256474 [Penaeus japonicus]|uniref:uncharacterized protein LOC122256474 n=1 Tax=Penaeus japonicus TaxID=27405 RepID=UPI001C714B7E|nr:uncharacterized protein LOC122256474 [Penaeus japonicus]